MSDYQYTFRIPKDAPELTYAGLDDWLGERETGDIGATVEITREPGEQAAMAFRLYGLLIARISAGSVYFTSHGDTHTATTSWLSQIASDNGLGRVFRVRRRKAEDSALWRAGLLTLDGDHARPVEGHGYEINRGRSRP